MHGCLREQHFKFDCSPWYYLLITLKTPSFQTVWTICGRACLDGRVQTSTHPGMGSTRYTRGIRTPQSYLALSPRTWWARDRPKGTDVMQNAICVCSAVVTDSRTGPMQLSLSLSLTQRHKHLDGLRIRLSLSPMAKWPRHVYYSSKKGALLESPVSVFHWQRVNAFVTFYNY